MKTNPTFLFHSRKLIPATHHQVRAGRVMSTLLSRTFSRWQYSRSPIFAGSITWTRRQILPLYNNGSSIGAIFRETRTRGPPNRILGRPLRRIVLSGPDVSCWPGEQDKHLETQTSSASTAGSVLNPSAREPKYRQMNFCVGTKGPNEPTAGD